MKPKAGGWFLYTIETFDIRDSCVFFQLSDLERKLSLVIPPKACQHIGRAFLCLRQIPGAAIIYTMDPRETCECILRCVRIFVESY